MNLDRRWPILMLTLLVFAALVPGRLLVSETEAAWTDSEYVAGTVGSGTWENSGYARSISGRLSGVSGISIGLLGNPLPWNGMQSLRSDANIGTSRSTSAGPYQTGNLLAVNGLAFESSATGPLAPSAPITGSSCAQFLSSGTPDYCAPVNPLSSAESALTAARLRISILGVLGLGAFNVDVITVTPARQLTASVVCDPIAGTSSATPPASADGLVQIGTRTFAVPAAGGATPISFTENNGRARFDLTLSSSVSAAGAPEGFSKLTLSGTATALGLLGPVLELGFTLNLVSAECGPGSPAALPLAAVVSARTFDQPTQEELTEAQTT
ncbi:MAG: hypothetical protein WBB62_10610, partial [Rhodococcus sp. (in: high G+C Gram-positive bacteria)]